MSTSPSLSNKQGEGGGGHGQGTDWGWKCSFPSYPFGGEGGGTSPCPTHPLYFIRLLSRLGLKAKSLTPYRPRSDWSERGENRAHSRSPFSPRSDSGEDEREMPGDRSRAEVSQRGTRRSRSISTDHLQSHGHDRYSPPRAHGACLTGARSPTTCSRSPQYRSQPTPWPGGEQVRYYQGTLRSHGEHPFSYDHLSFPYADTDPHRHRTGPRDRPRSREPSQDTVDLS